MYLKVKFEEKNKVREVEKPFRSEIEFEQEIDDIGLQLKEDQKENVIADVQEEQIKLLSQFEKVLEEPSAKVKPATSKTSPTKQLATQYVNNKYFKIKISRNGRYRTTQI